MRIFLELTNATGTRIDKELEINTIHLEEIFAELAQGIRWAKDKGSDRISLTITAFNERV